MAFTGLLTKLGSNECNEFFSDIKSRNKFETEDNTVLTVLRAVMNEERLATFTADPENKGIMQSLVVENEIRLPDDEKLTAAYYAGERGPFTKIKLGLYFHFIPNKKAADYIKQVKMFDEDYKNAGWVRLEDVSLYVDRSGDALVYQNETKQATMVFAPSPKRIQVMQMMMSCLPRLLPWAFKDHPATRDELDLLKMLAEQKYDKFNAAIDKICAAYDFYGKKVESMLKGFCSQNFTRSIHDQEERVRRAENNVNDYMSSARNAMKQVDEEQMKLLVLRNRACNSGDDEKELVDFFKANKSLIALDKSGNQLWVGVNCYLNDYNEDIFKQYVEKQDKMSSYIYEESPYDMDLTKKLFLAIWKEHRFNLRVYCEWIVYDDCRVEAVRSTNMNHREDLMKDRFPQPHIDRFTCYGGYRGMLQDLALRRDYIGVLSTLVTSSSYINWTDSTVVEWMMEKLFGDYSNRKCLEDKDGNLYTIKQVVEILENESRETA